MCGIAGCLIGPGTDPQGLQRIREIFQANLLANEQRGREATGIAICNGDGSSVHQKQALAAADFVRGKSFQSFLDRELTAKTTIILGHTREPTKGTVKNNNNNHPIIVGATVGVHNGVISNDDSIFTKMKSEKAGQRRIGSVDSEAIIALLDRVSTNQALSAYTNGLQQATAQLLGSYTTLFFNKKFPTTLFCLRYDNPISIHYDEELNSLFFSSRYLFLRKTFGRTVISKGMPGRTGFVFETEKIASQGKIPSLSFELRQRNEQERRRKWHQN